MSCKHTQQLIKVCGLQWHASDMQMPIFEWYKVKKLSLHWDWIMCSKYKYCLRSNIVNMIWESLDVISSRNVRWTLTWTSHQLCISLLVSWYTIVKHTKQFVIPSNGQKCMWRWNYLLCLSNIIYLCNKVNLVDLDIIWTWSILWSNDSWLDRS